MTAAMLTRQGAVVDRLWPDDVAPIIERCPRRMVGRREIAAAAGAPDEALHLVVRGRVAFAEVDHDGNPAIRDVAGPGDHFGLRALLRPSSVRASTVVALETTELAVITRDTFDRVRAQEPALERFVFDRVAHALERLSEQVSEATTLRAEQRVVRQLLALVPAFRSGSRATVKVRQQDLAWMAGTTRPTVNQVLRGLEAAGAVQLGRSRIDVLDVDALVARS